MDPFNAPALRYRRKDRKDQIVDLFNRCARAFGSHYAMTMGEVAKHIGLARSKHLMDMMFEIAEEGRLDVEKTTHYNGEPRFVFTLPGQGQKKLALPDDTQG